MKVDVFIMNRNHKFSEYFFVSVCMCVCVCFECLRQLWGSFWKRKAHVLQLYNCVSLGLVDSGTEFISFHTRSYKQVLNMRILADVCSAYVLQISSIIFRWCNDLRT